MFLQLAHGSECMSDNLQLPSSKIGKIEYDYSSSQRRIHDSQEHEKENTKHFQAHLESHIDYMDPNLMVLFTKLILTLLSQ